MLSNGNRSCLKYLDLLLQLLLARLETCEIGLEIHDSRFTIPSDVCQLTEDRVAFPRCPCQARREFCQAFAIRFLSLCRKSEAWPNQASEGFHHRIPPAIREATAAIRSRVMIPSPLSI